MKIKQEIIIKFNADLYYEETEENTIKEFNDTLIQLYKEEPEQLIDNLVSLFIDKKIQFDVKIKNIK
jgi:hypothetical protein